jgi:hypothetical protein
VRRIILAGSAALAAMLSQAHAADLETVPPPAAETPPLADMPPPAVAVAPEPACPIVWQCGYWGCGWRPICAPAPGGYWGPPAWGFYGPYGRPYWGGTYHRYASWHRPYWGGYRAYGEYRR